MIWKLGHIILLICCWEIGKAQTYTVETVPNTKLSNNSYVSNPDHLISDSTVVQIDKKLSSLEQQTTVQVALVLLTSIADVTDYDFAQKLFEKWGIGHAAKDNGLLILFIQDQKKVRLHTGFGLEGTLPDIICKRIEIQHMVPSFKEGNVDAGILAGVEEVIKVLTDPAYAEELRDDSSSTNNSTSDDATTVEGNTGLGGIPFFLGTAWLVIGLIFFVSKKKKSAFIDSKNGPKDYLPGVNLSSMQWLWWFVIVPILLIIALAFVEVVWIFWVGIYGYLLLTVAIKRIRMAKETSVWMAKEDYHALHNFYQQEQGYWKWICVLFPLPFVFFVKPYGVRMASFRTHPRACKSCGKPTVLLGEDTEDPYLNKSQVFEEKLKSVDYDVWKCESCKATQVYQYLNSATEFELCHACSTIALTILSTHTVSSASTTSQGLREIKKGCKFCGHQEVERVIIPVISSSSSSDSSGSSSSSSSGGSFGGGDSGGGGSSSSW